MTSSHVHTYHGPNKGVNRTRGMFENIPCPYTTYQRVKGTHVECSGTFHARVPLNESERIQYLLIDLCATSTLHGHYNMYMRAHMFLSRTQINILICLSRMSDFAVFLGCGLQEFISNHVTYSCPHANHTDICSLVPWTSKGLKTD